MVGQKKEPGRRRRKKMGEGNSIRSPRTELTGGGMEGACVCRWEEGIIIVGLEPGIQCVKGGGKVIRGKIKAGQGYMGAENKWVG